MTAVAAFLGGIIFTIAVAVLGLWWFTRGVDGESPLNDCPHCDGTGLRLESEVKP